MQRFILGRVVQSIVSMFVVSVVVFALVRMSGDPIQIMMPAEATKADIELMRAHLGLDRPWTVQYWRFATQALQGDFGDPSASAGPPSTWSSSATAPRSSSAASPCSS
jgi:peptide/nickel transport system permease protein